MTDNSSDQGAKIRDTADRVALSLDADVLIFNGPINRNASDYVIDQCGQRTRRANVFLMLTTLGGDPHAAYRIARTLQQHYKRLIAFVPGYCKSAGTLLILGAHELVISPHAELGPLDLQVPSSEVGERSSVLTPTDSLRVLQEQAVTTFVSAFQSFRAEAQLTTKLAAEMSATLVAGLFHDIFGQIDPLRLGELDRATRIAIEYGERLIAIGKNVQDDTLIKLVGGYPSHMFVIDPAETRDLFKTVRAPTEIETQLALREPLSDDKTLILFLSSEPNPGPLDAPKDGKTHERKDNGRETAGAGTPKGKADGPADRGKREKQDRDRGAGEKGDGGGSQERAPTV